jgi:uncharacterized protein YeaO (DUF488 family)
MRKARVASGVADVHFCQETVGSARARPFEVRPRGAYLARVASPEEGLAVLTARLEAGDWPRGDARVDFSCGLWRVRLARALDRRGRRKPWHKSFRHFCAAAKGLQEMRRVCDELERRALREALEALERLKG